MTTLKYIRATPNDCEILSRIAFESKQNWGYPCEWMQLWKPDLTLTPEYISENHVYQIYNDDELVGFYSIVDREKTEVDHLWLTPKNQRKGFGSQIFENVRQTISALGKASFEIVSEPNAKGFYEKMGGRFKSKFESKIPGRFLEIYEFSV